MKMGMDDAGKTDTGDSDTNGTDTDTTGTTDKMKDFFNSDSLKKGIEGLDSILKTLDPEKMKEMKEALKELEKMKQQ
ncbi:MAG: hypothetical protein IPN56_10395, partial [Chitinophagaceae bacterium]|nr:hypothetical protein [Chitinophagaceae bacterium]